MLDFATKYKFESKAVPGASVTIRRLSEMQRARRDAKIIEQRFRVAELGLKIDDLLAPYRREQVYSIPIPDGCVKDGVMTLTAAAAAALRASLPPEEDAPDVPQSVAEQVLRLNYERNLINAEHIHPATLRAGLISVKGFSYDGGEVTADLLLENGPDALTKEIVEAIEEHSGLTVEQTKNSSPSSDSSDLAAGENQSSTASTAAR